MAVQKSKYSALLVQSEIHAVVETADGLTTGLIPQDATFVSAGAAGDVNKIITLPADAVGLKMIIIMGATGCEIRTPAASNDLINNVDSDGGAKELALVADGTFEFICVASGKWIARGWDNVGADLGALVANAI